MNILWSPYSLSANSSRNRLHSNTEWSGALLKVVFEDGWVGYSDLHPLLEFGDPPLAVHLKSMAEGSPTSLATMALEWAKAEAETKRTSRSLYKNVSQISNHYLVTDLHNFSLQNVISEGYQTIKIKMGRDIEAETGALHDLCQKIASPLKLRLDFNEYFSDENFSRWMAKVQPWLSDHLDFIEDPCFFDSDSWSSLAETYGLRLALDMGADPFEIEDVSGVSVLVLKPARQNWVKIVERFAQSDLQFVVTHSMDHPVGQLAALSAACDLADIYPERLLDCGLQNLYFYSASNYSQMVTKHGRFIEPPMGSGWGLDSTLTHEPWRPIS
ncbi:MAG: hypothetical protein H6626_10025 [Pseudobdellovibrionaceae bacterium]|nr:hypothetical protein [Bdellovibrionales bacterium]USN46550.1 MAG: hypothetical protein H6626_10025 [Pseudobdellovibrionaceae bacterium]